MLCERPPGPSQFLPCVSTPPRGGAGAARRAGNCKEAARPRWSDRSASVVFLGLAFLSLIFERRQGLGPWTLKASSTLGWDRHLAGLGWSAVAIVGRPAASALRKEIATKRAGAAVSHAEQVGMTSLVQGAVAAGLLLWSGGFRCLDLPRGFWICLGVSAALNAVIKTSETHAYKIGEMSLCAPFLAFDPVIQLLVGTLLPVLWGGPPAAFSPRKASAVCCIAAGMLALAKTQQNAAGRTGRLPAGAVFVLLNCFLYSATYRLDACAVNLASGALLLAYSRLVMAALCFGAQAASSGRREAESGLWEPRTLALLLFVCLVDGLYMLSMYKAVSLISPELVAAVKRGGGIVVSALFGAIFFHERLEGRKRLLAVVALGVVVLCL